MGGEHGIVMNSNKREQSQRMRESPNLLAGIVGSAMDAIIAVDETQRIVLFNVAAEKMFACPANEAIGSSVERFIPKRFRAGHSSRVRRFGESGVSNRTLRGLGTLWGLRATGEEFPIEAFISKVESDGHKYFTVVIRDISERKLSEESLRASEERLRLAQQAAGIGTFEWNIQTGVNAWTPELEALYGLPPGGFGGTQTAFENLVHPDDRAGVIALDDRALKTGLPTKGEWRVVWPDGSVHWIAGRWQVYMNESGQPSRMVGVNIDITDRKLAEEALARANERLHLAIDSGSVGGWDFDLKTDTSVWFGKAHAQLGMKPEETLGSRQEFWDRVHEDDREHLRHAMRVAKDKHEEFIEDFRVVWGDGTTHWLRSRGRYQYATNGEPERMLGISLDITLSKQAEQALRESEQRFLLAAQAGKMYSFEWDVRTGAVVRSPEYVTVLGATEQSRSTHRQFVDKIHLDDRSRFIATIAALTPDNPTGIVTFRVINPDGSLVWLRSSGRGIFDDQGRVLRVIGMVADVTDQKLAEEELRAHEERLRLAQWAARIGTFDLNMRTGVDIWTPETEALYGLPPGGFGGTLAAFENLIHPDDRQRIIELTHEMVRTGQATETEWRVVWPDGSVHWIAGRAQVLKDESGKPSRMLGVNLDITERKRVEEAKFRMAAIVESSEDAIISENWDGVITSWNAGAEHMFAYTEAEAVGQPISIVVPVELQDEQDRNFEKLRNGECIDHYETVRVTKTGRRVNVSLSISPLKDSTGRITGFSKIARDISERKQMEEALSGMNRRLIDAQEQDRARIGRDLHDHINQQLALVAVELEQLRNHPPDSAIETCTRLKEIRDQVTAIATEVQSISHQLHSPQLEILGIVGATRSFCREFAARQKVSIDFTHDDIPRDVPHDVSLCLFRVLQEALHNAVKHSNVRDYKVRLGCSATEFHLTVSDRGIGFDAKTAMNGGGLGLVSMRERVRLVNGTIVIDSKPMGGTTIHVRVPFSEQGSQRAAG